LPDPAKVGLIFIVFVAVALISLLYLTGQAGWLSGRHMAVHFPDVEGLTEGAKVLLAGKEIGRVLRIDLASETDLKQYPDHAVVAYLSIDKGVVLYDTDEFTIAQAGMLGDTNIVVRRLSKEQREEQARLLNKPLVEPKALGADAHVTGTRIVGLAELGEDARGVLQQVKGAIADFHQVYAGPDVRRQLPLIMANVETATRNAVAFSEALARVSVQNEAKIGQIAGQIAAASVELNRSAVRVREMIAAGAPNIERSTSRVARMLDVSAANIEDVSASLSRTSLRVEKLVGTSAGDIETTARLARETLEKSSDNIQKTAAHVAGASEALETTVRSAGEDLAATTRRVRELVDGSADNVERAAEQVEKSTAALASLIETSSKDTTASTARVNQMVQVSAGDVEKTSANLAKLSEGMLADLSAVTGRARGMVEKSSADIERTTGRIAQMTEQSADDIQRTTRRLHDLVALSPLPNDLAATGAHIRAASEHIEKITSAVEGTVADPQFAAQIKTIVANLQTSSDHLLEMTKHAEALAGEGRQVTGELKGLLGDTRAAINTTSTNLNNEAMWTDIRATTAQLRQAMDDLAALTAQGRKILADPKVAQNITESIENVRTLTEQGIEVAKKADRSLTRVDETMDRVTNVAHSIQPDATALFFGLQGGEHSGLRADAGADLFYGEGLDSFWRVGLRDVGDAEGLILQRGLGLRSGGTLRMGIYGSKLSLGLDWPLSTRVAAELNLWNPNDPRLDVAAGLHLRHNWELLFGANELFSNTDPFVGLRRSLRPPQVR
jgi:ABC-type transporter Mla subunit MlaD